MVRIFPSCFTSVIRRASAVILAFTLICGSAFGAFLSTQTEHASLSLMHTAAESGVSIVSLLCVVLLPFLFTVFAVYIRRFWLVIPICFWKVFSFAYLYCAVLFSYGSSGWLVGILLMFSDILALPVLCWFWMRVLRSGRADWIRNSCGVFLLLSGIVILDSSYLSPYLVFLLS